MYERKRLGAGALRCIELRKVQIFATARSLRLRRILRRNFKRAMQQQGQATLEYALVIGGSLVCIIASLLVVKYLSFGAFLDRCLEGASHLFHKGLVGALQDLCLY